ncbi:MAG: nadD [Burkholderiales bacterium]|jgi:nicotinate-nucleotide adenylyltransferase|nr:nadD [Burkholderiales bacterium]
MSTNSHAYIILGGTFDPIHNGHILLAEALYNSFKQPVIFIPTAPPNYKAPPQTTAKERLEMLKLALNNNPHFIIDSCEMFEENYISTNQSLKILREKIGYDKPIYFLIGEDSLVSLDTWDNWHELFNLTNFVVAMRPGYSLEQMSGQLKLEFTKRTTCSIKNLTDPYGQIYILNFTPHDIASTTVRNNCKQNLPIEDMVDPKVAKYIKENKLYI